MEITVPKFSSKCGLSILVFNSGSKQVRESSGISIDFSVISDYNTMTKCISTDSSATSESSASAILRAARNGGATSERTSGDEGRRGRQCDALMLDE